MCLPGILPNDKARKVRPNMTQETLRALLRRDRAKLLKEQDAGTIAALRLRMRDTIAAIAKGGAR